MKYDAVVIGSGFTGSVIARQLSDRIGAKVLLAEKRKHIAGNMYDKYLDNGVLVHIYGPHSFITDDEELVNYIQRFAEWKENIICAQVCIDERIFPLPFGFNFIREYYGHKKAEQLIDKLQKEFVGVERVAIYQLLESTDDDIRSLGEMLCEKDYYPYTSKQWGIPMEKMDPSVISRVKFALSDDKRYIQQKYQYTPIKGFTDFFEKLLDTDNIDVITDTDGIDYISFENDTVKFNWEGVTDGVPVIYTGPVDELLGCKFGSLPYRSLDIKYESFDRDSYQDSTFISYPQAEGYTRIVEQKKLTGQDIEGKTTISIEYPIEYIRDVNIPYYPIINDDNRACYNKYREEANLYKNLFVCGRLGDYQYYNMDMAIRRAMEQEIEIESYMKSNKIG